MNSPTNGGPSGVSRRSVLAAGAVGGVLLPVATTEGSAAASDADPVRPASVIAVDPTDPLATRVAKAARVVPRRAQVRWQRREVSVFTHFGMNTFTDREWGSGCEDEATFAPPRVDVGQWIRAYRAGGARLAMLTAKHHDGFVLYPTRYTNHSVIASPWWSDRPGTGRDRAADRRRADPAAYWRVRHEHANPRGDILRDYLRAARRAGLATGVYLSPADGAELPADWHADWVRRIVAKHDAGEPLSIEEQATYDDRDRVPAGQARYGNGSAVVERSIPTLVPGDDRAGAVRSGRLPTFRVRADDYNAFYLNQLYELLTGYGRIDELWLDGANPWSSAGISQTYDFGTWFDLIRALSPETVVFGGPAGVRWVGNEDGIARTQEWSVIPTSADPATAYAPEVRPETADDLGSRAVLADDAVRFLEWYPAEADVSIRPGWFWHRDEQPKSAATLASLYRRSVGRNSLLLLNVPPATDGRVSDADVGVLADFRTAVTSAYRDNLLADATPARLAAVLTDTRLATAWSPAGNATTGTLTLRLPADTTFDTVDLGEDIQHGQHVEEFTVDGFDGTDWFPLAAGTTIGLRRILSLSAAVTTDRVRLRVTGSRAIPRLSRLGLYRTSSA